MNNQDKFIRDYLQVVKNKNVDENELVKEVIQEMKQSGVDEYEVSGQETISGNPELLYFNKLWNEEDCVFDYIG